MKKIILLCLFIFIATLTYTQNNSAVELFNQGKAAEISGNYYKAVEMYKSALMLNENYFDALSGLAHSYYRLGEYEESLKYILQSEKYVNKNTALMNLKGRVFLNMGEFVSAEEIFKAVLRIEENNIDAEFGLAELDIASGRIFNAEDRYINALLVSPESRKALIALVIINDNSGNSEKAEFYLRQALKFYSNNAHVQFIAADHFYSIGILDESLYHLKTALFLQPDYLEASILLSRIYMEQNKYIKSVEVVESIIGNHKDESILWYMLGRSYEQLDLSEKAVMSYARALSIKPDADLSRIALENVIIDKTPMDSEQRKRYSEYHLELGRKYEQRNMLDKSVHEFRRALAIDPYSVDARLQYAEINKRLNYIERYLLILSNIVEEGYKDIDILDEIEIRKSMLDETISEKWDINQFTIEKEINNISIFFENAGMNHYEGELVFSKYIEYLLQGFENIKIGYNGISNGFSSCFRKAREVGSDYFIIFNIAESERAVSINADIYLSTTGNRLKNIRIVRTGNQMIPEAGRAAVRDIHSLLPVFGKILNRRFDEVVVNLGEKDGIKEGDRLEIIKKGTVQRAKDDFSFEYSVENLLGYYDVNTVNELVSEGIVTVEGFFDMINPGDVTLFSIPDENEEEPVKEEDEQLFITGELFKSITNIP